MKQIITGPFGRLAYHDAEAIEVGLYPSLNQPCCAFARGERLIAANDASGPIVTDMPRKLRRHAAVIMFGNPVKRES